MVDMKNSIKFANLPRIRILKWKDTLPTALSKSVDTK
jgi:hypothetical protein